MSAAATSDADVILDVGNAVAVINLAIIAPDDATVTNDVAAAIAITVGTVIVAAVASVANIVAVVANTFFLSRLSLTPLATLKLLLIPELPVTLPLLLRP